MVVHVCGTEAGKKRSWRKGRGWPGRGDLGVGGGGRKQGTQEGEGVKELREP